MIYLLSKIAISLLASLGIGFGMAWMLQMHLAARLREQLNSVIFETKSRIPQLESEITNRDQIIDGLRDDLAKKAKVAEPGKNQQGSKEQEKQIDELRQKVIDLENELRMARGVVDDEAVFVIDESDRVQTEEPELMSDDEFLADIQDIFEDADDSIEAFGSASAERSTSAPSPEDVKRSIEEELQSELEGWDDSDSLSRTDAPKPAIGSATGAAMGPLQEHEALAARTPPRKVPIDLKAELLELEDDIRAGAGKTYDAATSQDASDIERLKSEVQDLAEARKSLNEIVDTQAREMAGLQQQRELQDKSLTVLNQQLELARMANERILRELRELKDSKSAANDTPRSAAGG